MLDLVIQKEKIKELAIKNGSVQEELYRDSIFLPYITLPNAKGKGTMMEEYFAWYFNESGIKTDWITTNANYDFLMGDRKIRVELKVASIGKHSKIAFNQLHFGDDRKVDKFLFIVIKPSNDIDMFLLDKKDLQYGKIRTQKQHGQQETNCARYYNTYENMIEELRDFRIDIDELKYIVS